VVFVSGLFLVLCEEGWEWGRGKKKTVLTRDRMEKCIMSGKHTHSLRPR